MKKLLAVLVVLGLIAAPVMPVHAREHVFIGVGVGGYYPYPGWGYPAYYYPPYYVAPPPIVYVPPAAPPPIVAPVTYAIAPAPIAGEVPIAANQTSPTFIDNAGRTCRHFQSTGGGPAYGTACLQSDGSWRTVQ